MAFTKLSQDYAAELKQVAGFADDLYGFLADQPNMLPIGFPSDAVITLCSALRQLPEGSVEGSVPILEAGLEQCPTIRRNYIPVEVGSDDPDYDPDAPPVYRGGELDVRINGLFVAIGTAIDAFKDEYGPGFREGIEIDPPVQARTEFVLDAAVNNARSAELRIAGIISGNEESLASNEELKRGLVDTDSELKVARSTASMPYPKPNLLSKLGTYITKAPEALVAVGKFSRAFADISSPVVNSAARIFVSGWQAMLDAISIAGEGLEESGRRMAAWRDKKWQDEIGEVEPLVPVNPEFDEARAVQMLLDGQELPTSWYSKVEVLPLGAKSKAKWLNSSASAQLISKLTNLKYADLSGSFFDDFSFLKNLTNLTELRLSNTAVKNLNFASELSKLRVLHLSATLELYNIYGVEKLVNLHSLQIRTPNNLDFSPLFMLERLESLIINPKAVGNDEIIELQSAIPNLMISRTKKGHNHRQRYRLKMRKLDPE